MRITRRNAPNEKHSIAVKARISLGRGPCGCANKGRNAVSLGSQMPEGPPQPNTAPDYMEVSGRNLSGLNLIPGS